MRSNHNHYTRTPNSAFNLLFVVVLSLGMIFGTYMTIKDDSKNATVLNKGLMNLVHEQDSTIKLLRDSLYIVKTRPIDIDTVYLPRPIKYNKIIKQDTTAIKQDSL